MSIQRIKVVNFKSFNELEIELGKFNVLIGANASGKSNFVSIFKFLKDITTSGLENAISLQGGIEYLRNLKIGSDKNFELKIVSKIPVGRIFPMKSELIGVKYDETIYKFSIKFYKRRPDFLVKHEEFIQKLKFYKLEENDSKELKEKELIGEGKISIIRKNGRIKPRLIKPRGLSLTEEDFVPPFFREIVFSPHSLLLETPIISFILKEMFSYISIYDFDPKLPKKATPITGKAELEEDGSNLSIILKNILTDKEKRRKLLNLLKNFLPFIENLDVEKFADKSLLFKLKEKYFRNQYLPASLISDGTINITALIIALFFEKSPLVIVEEPERNIHPSLIAKVVEIMKEASQKKQIIITTHNPEIVKYAGLENLLLISRDEHGFSQISRPADKETLRSFLENEIGIEELFVQNLLEI